ncbi:MAG: hypothetical protein LW875_02730 [Proteobacteria bacterium]|nr:hypothetical protein [Pseudomonadota bacterium]
MNFQQITLFIAFLLFSMTMRAQSTPENVGHVLLTPEELVVQNIARKKLYPGGVDEEPLKVHTSLQLATKKTEEESPAPDDSRD